MNPPAISTPPDCAKVAPNDRPVTAQIYVTKTPAL
jgi:hypothetical protein